MDLSITNAEVSGPKVDPEYVRNKIEFFESMRLKPVNQVSEQIVEKDENNENEKMEFFSAMQLQSNKGPSNSAANDTKKDEEKMQFFNSMQLQSSSSKMPSKNVEKNDFGKLDFVFKQPYIERSMQELGQMKMPTNFIQTVVAKMRFARINEKLKKYQSIRKRIERDIKNQANELDNAFILDCLS